jgi:hypothetical protein
VDYPIFQNFIADKFFPVNLDDNIRQMHVLDWITVNNNSGNLPKKNNNKDSFMAQELKLYKNKHSFLPVILFS